MKAVLVFCEGRHDVAFAQRSLGAHGGCEWVDKPVRELPSPFGPGGTAKKGLIAMRYERQSLEDLTLRGAAHLPLPCFEFVVENNSTDTLFVLVRTHGQDQVDATRGLLEELDVTISDESAWPQRYADARRFIDGNRRAADAVSGSAAARLKAIITAAGQFDHPGAPMTDVVRDRNKGLPGAQFDASPLSRDLADFLAAAPWNRP